MKGIPVRDRHDRLAGYIKDAPSGMGFVYFGEDSSRYACNTSLGLIIYLARRDLHVDIDIGYTIDGKPVEYLEPFDDVKDGRRECGIVYRWPGSKQQYWKTFGAPGLQARPDNTVELPDA